MKKVAIVGAGISGLSAGNYALQSGFTVTIFERHTIPGGASTSWRRKGYLFEGGMHWLTGSSNKSTFNTLWREVGALDDSVEMYNRDPFLTFEYGDRTVSLFRDIDRLRRHFLELSREDEKEINRFIADVKKFSKISMPISYIKGVRVKNKTTNNLESLVGMLPALARLPFYLGKSTREYSGRFKSPLLRNMLEHLAGPDSSALGMAFMVAIIISGDGGYPKGGSLGMAGRMARYFESLGGRLEYGKRSTG